MTRKWQLSPGMNKLLTFALVTWGFASSYWSLLEAIMIAGIFIKSRPLLDTSPVLNFVMSHSKEFLRPLKMKLLSQNLDTLQALKCGYSMLRLTWLEYQVRIYNVERYHDGSECDATWIKAKLWPFLDLLHIDRESLLIIHNYYEDMQIWQLQPLE